VSKPGASTTQEDAYTQKDEAHRNHWENGENGDLTQPQKDKLKEQADRAGRYSDEGGTYGDDYPRTPDGKIDHGKLVSNVKKYVSKGYPNNDNTGVVSPPRSLGHMIEVGGTPQVPRTPPDADPPTKSGETEWVCHNVAMYMAAVLRELGYAVREVNMYLSKNHAYTYQSAALQVWFEGKWHFVDPFTCTFDPLAALAVFDSHTDIETAYWDGTRIVQKQDWRVLVPLQDPWKKLEAKEVGNDLHRRFYPKQTDEHGRLIVPRERYPTRFAGLEQTRVASETTRASAEKSGVAIATPTPGVRLYLMDAQGRVTDRERRQIPGSFHVAAGTPIADDPVGPIRTPEQPERTKPDAFDEFVFFGTQQYSAAWSDIGSHLLILFVAGEPGQRALLQVNVLGDVFPVTVEGLPDNVLLTSDVVAVPFSVTIDPVDPGFHAMFELLLRNGLVDAESYWPAADRVHAMIDRRAGWQLIRRATEERGQGRR
jgi:hypothetical protein